MPLTDADIRTVARLARLALPEEEMAAQYEHINALMRWFEVLQTVDVTGVEPTSHVIGMYNFLRQDVAAESLSQEAVLRNAPKAAEGFFVVPRILED